MAYDESSHRRPDTSSTDPHGAGSSTRPGYRDPSAGSGDAADRAATSGTGWTAGDFSAVRLPDRQDAAYRGIPDSVLDDVFDDPRHGDPGRDRLGVHLFWELLLLAAVGALAFLLYREDPGAVRGTQLASLLVSAVTLGLLALGAGLSLRTGAPNLAVGPVAVASAEYFSEQGAGTSRRSWDR